MPFWLWPDSSFGQSILIQVRTAVQLTYPYRTSLAPQPPCCWQSPDRALTSTARRLSGGTLSAGLHTTPLPGSHANLGYCQSYGRSRHPIPQGSRRDKVGQSFRSWFTPGEARHPLGNSPSGISRSSWRASNKTSRPIALPEGCATEKACSLARGEQRVNSLSTHLTVGRCALGKPPCFRESS